MNDVTIKEIREYLSPIVKRNESLSQVLSEYRSNDHLIQYGNAITKIQQHQYVLSYICGFDFLVDKEKQYADALIEWIQDHKDNAFGFKNNLEMAIDCMSNVKTAIENAWILMPSESMQIVGNLADCYRISTSLTQKYRKDIFLKLFGADVDMTIAHLEEIRHITPFYKVSKDDPFNTLDYAEQMKIIKDIVTTTVAEFPKIQKLIRVMADYFPHSVLGDFKEGKSYGKFIFDIGIGSDVNKLEDPFPVIENNKYRVLAFCKRLQYRMKCSISTAIGKGNFKLIGYCIQEVSPEMLEGPNGFNIGNMLSMEQYILQILDHDMPLFIDKLCINLGLRESDSNVYLNIKKSRGDKKGKPTETIGCGRAAQFQSQTYFRLDKVSEDTKGEDINLRILKRYFPNWFDHGVDTTDKIKLDKEVATRICKAILELGWCGDENTK